MDTPCRNVLACLTVVLVCDSPASHIVSEARNVVGTMSVSCVRVPARASACVRVCVRAPVCAYVLPGYKFAKGE